MINLRHLFLYDEYQNSGILVSSINRLTNLKVLRTETIIDWNEPLALSSLKVFSMILGKGIRKSITFSGMAELTVLTIHMKPYYNDPIIPNSYESIASLPCLRYLHIDDRDLDSKKIDKLSTMTNLLFLSLDVYWHLRTINIKPLGSLVNLECLILYICTDPVVLLETMNQMKSLKNIDVKIETNLLKEQMVFNLPNLKHLAMSVVSPIGQMNMNIDGLNVSTGLRSLDLTAEKVTIMTSNPFASLKSLKLNATEAKLNMNHYPDVTELTLINLVDLIGFDRMTSVTSLSISTLKDPLMPESIDLLKGMTSLVSLKLDDPITEAGNYDGLVCLTKLKSLTVSHKKQIPSWAKQNKSLKIKTTSDLE